MRKKLALSLAVAYMIASLAGVAAGAEIYYVPGDVRKALAKADLKKLKSKSAMLIDVKTNRVLYSKNPDLKCGIASLTKIMTMLIVMDSIDSKKISFSDKVTASDNVYGLDASQVWLKPGEVFTVKELMESIAVYSACDSCIALAEHIAGSEENFVKMMNEKARSLGLKNTVFKDCYGLLDLDKGHYSTANDMAVISEELVEKHPSILEITKIWKKDFRPKGPVIKMENTNAMVYYYKGTMGLKTGFTSSSGYSLITVVKRGDKSLMTVLLGGPDTATRFGETEKMLNMGFSDYNYYAVSKKDSSAGAVNIPNGVVTSMDAVYNEDVTFCLNKNEQKTLQTNFVPEPDVQAPVTAGTKLGTVEYKIGKDTLKKVDVVASADNEKASWWTRLWRWVLSLFGK